MRTLQQTITNWLSVRKSPYQHPTLIPPSTAWLFPDLTLSMHMANRCKHSTGTNVHWLASVLPLVMQCPPAGFHSSPLSLWLHYAVMSSVPAVWWQGVSLSKSKFLSLPLQLYASSFNISYTISSQDCWLVYVVVVNQSRLKSPLTIAHPLWHEGLIDQVCWITTRMEPSWSDLLYPLLVTADCQGHSHPKLLVALDVGNESFCRQNTTHRS